ncbi:MAG TPA: hypothetical protein VJS67_06470, partial [Pseudonocardiaceae bacterium]|nr:hypothetical protein [Pseudonocardiaceae bacterium]
MLTGLLGAALALPGRVLEALDPDQVAGRRATVRDDQATIELRCAQRPNGSRYSQTLVHELQQLPGVVWACVNAPLNRVIIALTPTNPPALPTLVAVVDRVESRIQRTYPDKPAQAAESDRWVALGVNLVGAAAAAVGAVVRFTPLPAEMAALVTALEAQPRVRRGLEAVLGRPATDVGLAVLNAAGQSLSGGWLGLSVDAAQRMSALGETRAVVAGWRAREIELLADPQHAAAEPVVVERPCPLPPARSETYAE